MTRTHKYSLTKRKIDFLIYSHKVEGKMDRGNMEGSKKRMRGRKKEKGMERDRYIDILSEHEYLHEDPCL